MRNSKPPLPSPAEIELKRILKRPYQNKAFETLCKKGCEREWLASQVLRLSDDRPIRNRSVHVNRGICRALRQRLVALACEFDEPSVRHLCLMHSNQRVETGPVQPPIIFTNDVSFATYAPSPQVEFDINILCQQLRAGADYLHQLGNQPERVSYSFIMEDFNLQSLLHYVKEQTKKAYYKEVSILSEAVTGRHSKGSLKQRIYRAHSGRGVRSIAGKRQNQRGKKK